MKRTIQKILLVVFFITTGNAKAQELTFDETVTYIQEILTESRTFFLQDDNADKGYLVGSIIVKKNGKITFTGREEFTGAVIGSVNISRCAFESDGENHVFKFKKWDKNTQTYITLGSFVRLPPGDELRLQKAFSHLQSLCTEKDPFGQ